MKSESVSCSVVSKSFVTPWTVDHQTPPSMRFLQARILAWVAIPFSGDLPDPRLEPRSSTLQADSLPSESLEEAPHIVIK